MLVVVLDVVAHQAFELAAVPDDGAIEKLSADRSDPALGERVRDRGPHGVLRILKPSVRKISGVAEPGEFALDAAVSPGRVLLR